MSDFFPFWRLGYHDLIPVAPPDAKGMPGVKPKSRGKVPGELNGGDVWKALDKWQLKQATEADLIKWTQDGASVGMRCGYGNGLVAIDVDTLDERLASIARDEIEDALGPLPERIGMAPKFLVLCRTDPAYGHPDITFAGGVVEMRTYGHFVAAGPHAETRQPYRWTRALLSTNELPYIDPGKLDALCLQLRAKLPLAELTSTPVPRGPPPPQYTLMATDHAMLERAIDATPNDYRDRRIYVNMGIALRAACALDLDVGLRLYKKWCDKWTHGDNDEETVEKEWRSFRPPFEIGARWIYSTASWRSPSEFPRGIHLFEPIPDATAEKSTPVEILPDLMGTPFDFPDPGDIEPEDFLYSTWMVREYVSLIAAQTKVGKSLFTIAAALAMATGKPLLGESVERRLRVRMWNGEDTRNTLRRRVTACMKHYGITREDVGDRLFIDAGRDQKIVTAIQTRSGAVIQRPVVDALILALQKQQVDVLVVDPFIKTHQISENDNSAVDTVMQEWVRVTTEAKIALLLVHHSRKLNGNEATLDDSRGGSALPSATRAALVLARMTKREARPLGREKDYKGLFRVADAASNLAAAPGDDDKWFEIKSVDLCNGRFDENGAQIKRSDRIGVAVVSATRGSADEEREPTPERQSQEAQALAMLASGNWKESISAKAIWAGHPIAIAFGLDADDDKIEIKSILKAWAKQKKIKFVSKTDKNRNDRIFVEVCESTKTDLFG